MKKVILSIIVLILSFLILGLICKTPNKIIKRDTNFIYVKEYSLYNRDSTVVRYNADKLHSGTVINKRRGRSGRHTYYAIKVRYSGREKEFRTNYAKYKSVEKGSKITVKEAWYPYYSIKLL